MLFLNAIFAITVIGRALASLSDFYEHTCEEYNVFMKALLGNVKVCERARKKEQ